MNEVAKNLPNGLKALSITEATAHAFSLLRGADRAALGVFAFAGLSDAADGFLAKRFGLTTRFGRLLDPAADKVLMLVSFATLTILRVAPLWLTLLVLARDAAIVAGLLLARLLNIPVRVAPLLIGKASMAMQIIYIALALVLLTFGLQWPMVESAAADATALLTAGSWLGYAVVGAKALARQRSPA